jgi:hypothetical protein
VLTPEDIPRTQAWVVLRAHDSRRRARDVDTIVRFVATRQVANAARVSLYDLVRRVRSFPVLDAET